MKLNSKYIILPIFLIIFILISLDANSIENKKINENMIHIRNRKIYNNFKNVTMSILIKEWEKSYYDFIKLKSATYLLTEDRCYFSLAYMFFMLIYRYKHELLFDIISNYPFISGVIYILGVYMISNWIPIIMTDTFLLMNFFVIYWHTYLNNLNNT